MVESDVLKFGDFTLKSGRKSQFFMNAGAYVTGSQLHRLGQSIMRKRFMIIMALILMCSSGRRIRGSRSQLRP